MNAIVGLSEDKPGIVTNVHGSNNEKSRRLWKL
jgi:hypothetical protein